MAYNYHNDNANGASKMKTLNSTEIKVNGKDSVLSIKDGALVVSTKLGDMNVSFVNEANKTITFNHNEKEIRVSVDGDFQVIKALYNCVKSEKARELVIFQDYSEYLKNNSKEFGACFQIGSIDAAYRYL